MLSFFLLLPLAGLIILNLPIKYDVRKMQITGIVFSLWLSISQAAVILFHPQGFWEKHDFWGKFLRLSLYVDNLTLVMLLSIAIVVFVSVLVGWQMFQQPKQRMNFINLVLICLAGMNGIVLLADIFSLYIFLEVTAIASFILIAFNRDISGLEGAFKYIIMSAIATIMLLSSIAMLFLFTGDTSFASVSQAVKNNSGNVYIISAAAIFICGLLIKGGVVPFHSWLLGAYSSAPAAVSVLLAGIITKTAGIYVLIRFVTTVFLPIGQINNILMVLGTVSILFGAFAALKQEDFKRTLAYSSISQVGYIVLGLGCGTPLGIAAAIFHLFNHSIFKSLLFVNSAAVEMQTGFTDMNKVGGLGAKMPWTNASSLTAVLSTAGIPPTAGFWSKLLIIIALWQANHYAYAVIAIVASVITLAYLLSIQRKVFFGIIPDTLNNIKEAGFWIVLPSLCLAIIILATGLCFPLLFNTFLMPVSSIFK